MENYSDYLAEKLDKDITYSEYIAKQLDSDISYSDYVYENLNREIKYSDYIDEYNYVERIKEREAKIDELLKEY